MKTLSFIVTACAFATSTVYSVAVAPASNDAAMNVAADVKEQVANPLHYGGGYHAKKCHYNNDCAYGYYCYNYYCTRRDHGSRDGQNQVLNA
ncbi:UNVERIFIED_CONTAM: hypothetical protein HDU68_005251 [Siphonaria sp. JEL0065]|nr:hypothetical protein HDU68_005251 [Siphonaria sp. JEL0065]